MKIRLYSRAIAVVLMVFFVALGALPAQAALKKPVKAAHGKTFAGKPPAKASGVAAKPAVKKGHTATVPKVTATKPAARKRAGARSVPKPMVAAGKVAKASKKPVSATSAKVGGRKTHASKAVGASAAKGKKLVPHKLAFHKPAVKPTAKPRKVKKTAR